MTKVLYGILEHGHISFLYCSAFNAQVVMTSLPIEYPTLSNNFFHETSQGFTTLKIIVYKCLIIISSALSNLGRFSTLTWLRSLKWNTGEKSVSASQFSCCFYVCLKKIWGSVIRVVFACFWEIYKFPTIIPICLLRTWMKTNVWMELHDIGIRV